MQKAGIEGKTTRVAAGGRALSSLSFHSLRHSSIPRWRMLAFQQEIRQKFTGHVSADVNTHYTHHELEPLRAAISLIPSLGAK